MKLVEWVEQSEAHRRGRNNNRMRADDEQGMTHGRRALIAKVVGVVWPVPCLLITICTLLLIGAYVPSATNHVEEPLLWLNGLLSIAGSVAAGIYSARDHERGKAAIVFAVWAAFLAYLATSFYQLHFLNQRQ